MYTFENDKYKVEITHDTFAESPRSWCPMGKMLCFHRGYSLPKEVDIDSNDFNGWAEMKQYLERHYAVVLPLYMYDHSGITIATTPFGCPWDSGQIGFIVADKPSIRYEFKVKHVTKKSIEKATEMLQHEVEVYDQYITGDVYMATITDKTTDEEMDSCGGYYGTDFKTNGVYDFLWINFCEAFADEIIENLK